MQVNFSGTVHYANGDPISNVSVRIFDKDASGKQDDDLTVVAGHSDERGRFNLIFEPLRYLDFHAIQFNGSHQPFQAGGGKIKSLRIPDFGDVYLPYLLFNYTYNGRNCEYAVSLGVFQADFYLPVNPPVEFLPSRDGFKFLNSFPGYFLPYSPPAFMRSRKVYATYGLCGGMCAAAYDVALAKKAIPQQVDVPHQGSRLQRYLFRRQLDSWGGLGQEVVKVAQWTCLPEDTAVGTYRRTADAWDQIHQKLDEGNLVILALIYEHAASLKELSRHIFNNHQVLAYGYTPRTTGGIDIHVYDPNLPGRDDVVIHSNPVVLGEENSPEGTKTITGLASTQLVGGSVYKQVRGYFAMPYQPEQPPKER